MTTKKKYILKFKTDVLVKTKKISKQIKKKL